jgi:hypothetical protein
VGRPLGQRASCWARRAIGMGRRPARPTQRRRALRSGVRVPVFFVRGGLRGAWHAPGPPLQHGGLFHNLWTTNRRSGKPRDQAPSSGWAATPTSVAAIAAWLARQRSRRAAPRSRPLCASPQTIRRCPRPLLRRSLVRSHAFRERRAPSGRAPVRCCASGMQGVIPLRRCLAGGIVEVAQGEHSWYGKVVVDKCLTIRGERDRVSGFPASILRGRSVPARRS